MQLILLVTEEKKVYMEFLFHFFFAKKINLML